MDVNLREITKDIWFEMLDVEITKEQENYVALPSEAIAASKFYDYYVNRGVYLEDKPIGFIQYYPNHENGKPSEIFIDQLLIDVSFQGRGYGSEAIKIVLEEIKQLEGFKSISICHVEGHDAMKKFFEQFNFTVVEQDEFDETIMELHYT
ncbi:GNAT family N-acetyltransferase [Veronia pacifica]|uniref:GNAT family acetyltransferase n=1 Tax=Veronia pacifica TaxID=1080227 RepID=A0A1C3ESJ5_9GAMM|nr:GNAT family N-acetyltransferase [Veronia pacifica]ODA36262.1 GNAT family acetyltransferase [Veronia pacifica]